MSDEISIAPAGGTWVVRAGGAVIGESGDALRLREAGHEDRIYFPRDDIATAFLEPSELSTTCPRKGEASYYTIHTKSGLIQDAAWSYEDPKPAARDIAGYLSFDPEKATVEEI
ncbi:MAG: DUF427 domain-containing protein [Tranquillimonas sp.]